MPANIPPEIVSLMKGVAPGQKPGAVPGMSAGAGGPPGLGVPAPTGAPLGSPMSTPESKEGDKQGAKVSVQIAMDMLEQTLPAFGGESEEGTAVLDILSKLSKVFGKSERSSRELIPAELMQLQRTMPQMGGASAGLKSLAGQPTPGAGQIPLPV